MGIALAGCAATRQDRDEGRGAPDDAEDEPLVTPGEDLMQEHGVLERVVLVYDEARRRIDGGEALDPSAIARAARLVRHFVEDYHEWLEETRVFPRLEAARRELELVAVLRTQHQRGRELTDEIERMCASRSPLESELARVLEQFTRMYRPHAAREDTVLFPAFREVVGRAEYAELGEQFEELEHERVGEHGFRDAVTEVARIEEALGIADLARFTPRAS